MWSLNKILIYWKARGKVCFFSSPFLPFSISCIFFFCKMVLCKLQMLISVSEWNENIKYCLACELFCLKTQHQQNANKKKPQNTNKPTLNTTVPPKPPILTLPAVSAFLLSLSHLPASTTKQHRPGSHRLHGHTGNILPLSHPPHPCDYPVPGHLLSPLPGHEAARPAVSGRSCHVPKLNLTVLFNSSVEHVLRMGRIRHRGTKRNSSQGCKWNRRSKEAQNKNWKAG